MGSFSVWHWVILGTIAYLIYSVFRREKGPDDMVCKSCGFRGTAKSAVRGHLAIEIILWLCVIVPGLIYSIWRHSSRYNACPQCGSKDIIPADSPIGKKIVADLSSR